MKFPCQILVQGDVQHRGDRHGGAGGEADAVRCIFHPCACCEKQGDTADGDCDGDADGDNAYSTIVPVMRSKVMLLMKIMMVMVMLPIPPSCLL